MRNHKLLIQKEKYPLRGTKSYYIRDTFDWDKNNLIPLCDLGTKNYYDAVRIALAFLRDCNTNQYFWLQSYEISPFDNIEKRARDIIIGSDNIMHKH